jgi:hypothetical protein
MSAPDRGLNDAFNRELDRECEYDRHELDQSVHTYIPLLNSRKKCAVGGGLFGEAVGGGHLAVSRGGDTHYSWCNRRAYLMQRNSPSLIVFRPRRKKFGPSTGCR